MSASKGPAATTSSNVGIGSIGGSRSTSSATVRSAWNSTPSGGSLIGDNDELFGPSSHNQSSPEYGGLRYDDVFGGPTRYSNQGRAPPSPLSSAASPFDSLFLGSKESLARASSMPVYDKFVYDDDIFDGVPGMKSTAIVRFDDVFASMSNVQDDASHYNDLLGNFGRAEPELKKGSRGNRSGGTKREVTGFDDLIPGFGGSCPPPNRFNKCMCLYKNIGSHFMGDPMEALKFKSYAIPIDGPTLSRQWRKAELAACRGCGREEMN